MTRLPSILELGKLAALAMKEGERFDEQSLASEGLESDRASAAMELAQERGFAIFALIATMPPKTLADAAVQIRVAILIAATIHDNNDPAGQRKGG